MAADDKADDGSPYIVSGPLSRPRGRMPWLRQRDDGTWKQDPEWHNPTNDVLLDHPEFFERRGYPPLTDEERARLEHARALHLERERRKREQAEAEAGQGEG